MILNHLTWVLGTELHVSAIVAKALNNSSISLPIIYQSNIITYILSIIYHFYHLSTYHLLSILYFSIIYLLITYLPTCYRWPSFYTSDIYPSIYSSIHLSFSISGLLFPRRPSCASLHHHMNIERSTTSSKSKKAPVSRCLSLVL